MENIDLNLSKLATDLADLAIKGTVNTVHKKIEQYKEIKNCDELRNHYDDLINEILQERDDAIRIANVYKNEIEKYTISDEQIDYIQTSFEKIIMVLKNYISITENQEQSLEILKGLLTKDTLKVMQLLGFNYKQAIGEPLTELCANAISRTGNRHKGNGRK